MKIRPYEDKDSEEIKRLFLLLDNYSSAILSDELRRFEEVEDLQKAINSFVRHKNKNNIKKRKTFVADVGKGKIAGFITGSVSRDFPGFRLSVYGNIEVFFVEEKYRGRGIGRNLYKHLREWFEQKKCEVVRVDTWITNEPAIRVYEKMGFREIALMFVKEMER